MLLIVPIFLTFTLSCFAVGVDIPLMCLLYSTVEYNVICVAPLTVQVYLNTFGHRGSTSLVKCTLVVSFSTGCDSSYVKLWL